MKEDSLEQKRKEWIDTLIKQQEWAKKHLVREDTLRGYINGLGFAISLIQNSYEPDEE